MKCIHTFKKNIFLEMGGDMRCSSEMGGGDTRRSSKMGGCTQMPPKMGGGLMRGRRPPEKGYPPSGCFLHLPLDVLTLLFYEGGGNIQIVYLKSRNLNVPPVLVYILGDVCH